MPPPEKPAEITSETRVSLGFLRDTQTYVLAGCVWLIVNMESIKHRLGDIEERMPQTWTYNDQLIFEGHLQIDNPSLKVRPSAARR